MPRFVSYAAMLMFGGLLLAAPAPTNSSAPKSITPEQIKQAIEDLGSPKFPVRERASKFLLEAGNSAEDALRNAAKSKDEETSNRAKAILEKFAWGLYPDTPANVVALIEKFRGGDPEVRRQAVGELMRMKPVRFATLRKLIAQEQNEEAREEMFRGMTLVVRRVVPGLLVASQLDEAASLLELSQSQLHPESLNDYATFHYLRGNVPAAIQQMERAMKNGPEAETQRAAGALVHLYRLKEDWPAARKAVAMANNKELEDNLAFQSNDWKKLTELDRLPREGDDRGTRAAYFRLSGNLAKYDEIIAELKKELTGVEGDDTTAYSVAVALLLNGRGADAIAMLKERPGKGASLTFDLLCAQLKFKEAFALADKAAKEYEKDEGGYVFKIPLDLERAKVLAGLGDRDAATQIFRGVLDLSLKHNHQFVELVRAAVRAGMHDLAIEFGAKVLASSDALVRQGASEILDPLVGDNKQVALLWWQAYRLDKPDEDAAKRLNRVLEFTDGKADKKKAEHLAGLIEKLREAFKTGQELPPQLQIVITGPSLDFAIAQMYRAVGHNEKAEKFFKKIADAKAAENRLDDLLGEFDLEEAGALPVPTHQKYLLTYGDFLLAQKRPKEAAEMYRKAWDLAPFQPLPLFLHGHALKLAGNDKEGKRLIDISHWIALGNDATRSNFGDELSKRGFDADSRREMEIILATGWFDSYHYGNALARLARTKVRQKDYATASLYFDKDVIGLSRSGAGFVENRAYLTVPELARTYRAQALVAVGKLDAALAEARLGLEAMPGNVELAIALVPNLEKSGKKQDADEIYAKVKAAFDSSIKDFASSADLRNSLAWMMVNCNRELDEARKHAEQAVKFAPKSAGYLDTLAEIHFRQKDRAKALEFMKQCAAIEPNNPYFRKQLERFEKKPFDSPLPDEETGDDD